MFKYPLTRIPRKQASKVLEATGDWSDEDQKNIKVEFEGQSFWIKVHKKDE
jgi:hypothetical protein